MPGARGSMQPLVLLAVRRFNSRSSWTFKAIIVFVFTNRYFVSANTPLRQTPPSYALALCPSFLISDSTVLRKMDHFDISFVTKKLCRSRNSKPTLLDSDHFPDSLEESLLCFSMSRYE